jgi:hypothetical protein
VLADLDEDLFDDAGSDGVGLEWNDGLDLAVGGERGEDVAVTDRAVTTSTLSRLK